MVLALLLLLVFPVMVPCWPASWSCDYSCMAALKPGGSFGYMGIPNFGPAPTGSNCAISTDIPAAGYAAGRSYLVTVTSTEGLARKVACDRGGFDGKNIVDSSPKDRTTSHTWTATADGTATFRAICGSGGLVDKMWVADAVTISKKGGSVLLAPTPAPTPTPARLASVPAHASTAALELTSGLSIASSTVTGKQIELEVTSSRSAWIGIGFSKGKSISMTGDGQGVDTFVCASGAVLRYWMTSYSTPTGGVAVPGSTCSHISGRTTMKFRRTLAGQVLITPGKSQIVIYAQGGDGSTAFGFHQDFGGKNIDLQSLAASEAPKKSGEAVLYLHMIFMTLSWGALLPWGVALANRTRAVPGAPKGAWFKLHVRLQSVGWLLQLLGFAFGVWHVSENVGKTLRNPHTIIGLVVVLIGTQQPFNAILRKYCEHPEPGRPRSPGRLAFELAHKGLGYLSVVLGILNVWYGIWLICDQGYNSTIIIVSITLAMLGTLPVLGYFLLSLVNVNNPCSKMCTGSSWNKELENGNQIGKPA